MRRIALALIACLLLAAAAQAQNTAPMLHAQVLRRLPHDTGHSTQGLILVDGVLFEGTGQYGESALRRIDPETGRVLTEHFLVPTCFGEGIAMAKGRLLQLTWKSGTVFLYGPDDLAPLGALRLPTAGLDNLEGWGLASCPCGLLFTQGTDGLFLIDPDTLAVLGEVRVHDGGRAVRQLNELECVNGYVLANIWLADRIAVIRPDSGEVVVWIDLSRLRQELGPGAGSANGIAYDQATGRLFITGKLWDTLYEIRMPDLPPASGGFGTTPRP